MKSKILLFITLFFLIIGEIVSQEANDPKKKTSYKFYIGLDLGKGRKPLNYESFEGTMIHYPNDPLMKDAWIIPDKLEGTPGLSIGGKIGVCFKNQRSNIQFSPEIGIEYSTINYQSKYFYIDSKRFNYTWYHNSELEENDFIIHSLNIIPRFRVINNISNNLNLNYA